MPSGFWKHTSAVVFKVGNTGGGIRGGGGMGGRSREEEEKQVRNEVMSSDLEN